MIFRDKTHWTILAITLILPFSVFANYFTLPIDVNPETNITSWFDHDTVSAQMTKYNGNIYSGASADEYGL